MLCIAFNDHALTSIFGIFWQSIIEESETSFTYEHDKNEMLYNIEKLNRSLQKVVKTGVVYIVSESTV